MSTLKPPTKYRASCDGCYLAKLKCTKEKPTCPRCKNLGMTCTYSPSQRTGKHRGSKSQASSSTGSTTATKSSTHTAPSTSQALEWQPTISSQTSTIVPSERFLSNNDPPKSPMDTTTSNWSSSATMLHDFDTNILAPWRNYLPNSDKDEPLFKMSDDLAGDFTGMTPEPSDAQSLAATDVAFSHSNRSTCNCFDSITQALQEMHMQSRGPSAPSLEATLSCSKEITSRGEVLLNCSCTEDSTLIMLFAALIAKFLSLYAANIDFSSPPSSASFADTSDASSRVKIGRYTMDVQDEERLRTEIIMMELGKLNTLLMRFRGKFSSLNAGYEGHTYETMLDFLNTRLREAMNKLQRQKQTYQPAS